MRMRALIQDKIQSGGTDESIKRFLVSRYGEYIVYKPVLSRNTFFLWALPCFFFLMLMFIWIGSVCFK